MTTVVGVSTVPVTGTSQALELLLTANKNRYVPHARDQRGSPCQDNAQFFKAMDTLLFQGLPALVLQVLPRDSYE